MSPILQSDPAAQASVLALTAGMSAAEETADRIVLFTIEVGGLPQTGAAPATFLYRAGRPEARVAVPMSLEQGGKSSGSAALRVPPGDELIYVSTTEVAAGEKIWSNLRTPEKAVLKPEDVAVSFKYRVVGTSYIPAEDF